MKFIKELRQGFKEGRAIFVRGSGIALGILIVPLSIFGAVYLTRKVANVARENAEKFLVTKEWEAHLICERSYLKEKADLRDEMYKKLIELSPQNPFIQSIENQNFKSASEKYENFNKVKMCGFKPRKWIWSK